MIVRSFQLEENSAGLPPKISTLVNCDLQGDNGKKVKMLITVRWVTRMKAGEGLMVRWRVIRMMLIFTL